MPERVQEAMQMQVEAERKKRAAILESEGELCGTKSDKMTCGKIKIFLLSNPILQDSYGVKYIVKY